MVGAHYLGFYPSHSIHPVAHHPEIKSENYAMNILSLMAAIYYYTFLPH